MNQYPKSIWFVVFLIILALTLNASSLNLGESSPSSESAAGVEQSSCRILPGTPEYDEYIEPCEIDSDCVRFMKEYSNLMQKDTCDALRETIIEACDIAEAEEKEVLIAVQLGLDPPGGTEQTESPLVEGRGVRFYSDTPLAMPHERLSDIATNYFDFTMNEGTHIYASVIGEREGLNPTECSTTVETWNEGIHSSDHTVNEMVDSALAIILSAEGKHHSGLIKWMESVTGFIHLPLTEAVKSEFAKSFGGRFLVGWLGVKIGILDKLEVMCNDIDYFILLKPNLTEPVVVNTLDFFINLLEPFYLLAIGATIFYLLSTSSSPLGRARAKSTLLRMIISVGFIILTIPIFQLLLDLTHIISAYTMDLVDINITKTFLCTECINALNYEYLVIMLIAFFTGLFIALFQIIFYLGAMIILVLRYFMVIMWAIFFPFTIFFNSFHLTRRLGHEMLFQTGWWIAMQFIEALVFLVDGYDDCIVFGSGGALAFRHSRYGRGSRV
ncbi:MAG: hypothetical protein B6U97_00820 [Candidatus Altiarchaeales archaeon ex4484_96]|nr:MAG: hypothetical protein B6U97_00820 [Candidatus Altiarchaeales archaeon ex4484_96]